MKKRRPETRTKPAKAAAVRHIIPAFFIGKTRRNTRRIGERISGLHHFSLVKGMRDTAPLSDDRFFAGQRHAEQRQIGQIVAKRKPGALAGALPHPTAKAAVNALIIFILPHAQFRTADPDIAKHTSHLTLSYRI